MSEEQRAPIVIKIVGVAGRMLDIDSPATPLVGRFVKAFDFEAFDGRGDGTVTSDPEEALKFDTTGDGYEFWMRQSLTRPLRADGKPNRPMTALHVEIGPMETKSERNRRQRLERKRQAAKREAEREVENARGR